MFTKPKLFSKSRLRDAQLGNDGTEYATCPEAFVDINTPFAVRGEIVNAADIAALSSLKGTTVQFNATGNPYRITGVVNKCDISSGIYVPSPDLDASHSVVIGTYLYVIITSTPGILRVDISGATMLRDAALYFTTAGTPRSICASPDGNYLFVSHFEGFTTDGKISKINVSSFAIAETVTLAVGDFDPRQLLHDGYYLYVVTVTTPARVLRINTAVSPMARVEALALNAGEDDARALYKYGTDLFIGTYQTPAKIVKVDSTTSPMTRTAVLTLNAGEDHAHSFVHIGTELFVGLDSGGSNVAVLVKINPAAMTRTSKCDWAIGDSYNYSIATDGTWIYGIAFNTSPAKIMKVDPAAMTVSTTLTLNAGENNPLFIIYSAGYLYCSGSSSNYPAVSIIAKLACPALTRDSVLSLQMGAPASSLLLDGDDIFVAGGTPLRVSRINKNTGEVLAYNDMNAGEAYGNSQFIASDGNYFYFAEYDAGPVNVLKVDRSTLARVNALALAATEEYCYDTIIDGTNLYIACARSGGNPSIVVRVDLTTFTKTGSLALNAGETTIRRLFMYSGSLYAVLGTIPSAVVKINPIAMTRTSAQALNAGEDTALYAAASGQYLYISCSVTPTKLVKFDMSAMARIGVYTSTESFGRIPLIYNSQVFWPVAGKIHRLDLALSLIQTHTTSISYAILLADTNGYAVFYLKGSYPNIIYKMSLVDGLTLFERLQTADIGDSFSIRAPLTSAQESDSRPMIYASDGHISPRAQGTENTQLVLRSHAPNFLEDGGFESGAFSPNWTAGGANWTVVTANKLIGAYSAQCDFSTNDTLIQSVTKKLKKGKTYRLIFKADSLTAAITAGAITIALRQAGSLTPLDSTMSGTQPVITTTAEWFEIEFTPAFNTNNWQLVITPNLSLKGSSTGVILDEFYLYRKSTMNSLWVDGHNWGGRGRILVKPRRYSGLRSTAHEDAAFARASVAYDSEGNQSLANIPRYEAGRDGKINGAIIVEEGATNLLTANQSDAGDTLGNTTGFAAWSAGTVTITRDTTTSRQGAGCIKCVTGGDAIEQGVVATKSGSVLNPSQSHSKGVWLKGTGTVYLRLTELTAALAVVGGTDSSAIVLSNTWTWYSVTRLFGATGVNAYLTVYVGAGLTAAVTIYTDMWQLEEKAYATTWQLAGGAARAVETLAVPSWVANRGNWSFSARIKPLDANGATNARRLCGYYIDANNYCILDLLSSHRLSGQIKSGGVLSTLTPTNTLPVGAWYHIEWSGDGVNQKLFLNGVQIGASTAYTEPVGVIPSFGIGSVAGTSNYGNSTFDDVQLFNRALTDPEVAALYTATDPRTLSSYASCTWHQNFDSAIDSGGFEVDEADRFLKYIPTSEWPCVELTLPAAASWTPEAGEIYIGDYWQLPGFCKGPLDPYRTNADGLIDQTWRITNINPALRTTTIEDLFEALRSGEAILSQWDANAPIMMESPREAKEAPYNPTKTDMTLKLLERL